MAVKLLLEIVVERWKENVKDRPIENFRLEHLWTYPIELIFTMNEEPL